MGRNEVAYIHTSKFIRLNILFLQFRGDDFDDVTDRPTLQAIFTRLKQEYSVRDYLGAVLEELHHSEQLFLIISTEPREYNTAGSARRMAGALDEGHNKSSVAPDASMGALIHAVFNDYREHGDVDKRMLLLYQFLEYNHAKQALKSAESVQPENVSLESLQKVSAWLSMNTSDWEKMFNSKEFSKGLHPVLYLR
jgi:hypothetical protein